MIDWINCQDAMPADGTEVYVWTSRGARIGQYSNGKFQSVPDYWKPARATHWAFIDPPIEAESVAQLSANQVHTPPEMQRVMDKHFWELADDHH